MENTGHTLYDSDEIIRGYKKFFDFVFYKSKYIIIPLLSFLILFILFSVFSKKDLLSKEFEFSKALTLLSGYELIYNEDISATGVKMEVFDDKFFYSENLFDANWNLFTYKGYVFPDIVYLQEPNILLPITTFNNSGYNLDDFVSVVKKIVFTDSASLSRTSVNNVWMVSIKKSIMEDFNISCLEKRSLNDYICSYYTKRFRDLMPVYDLSKSHKELNLIYSKLYDNERELFCSSLKKYVTYTNDVSLNLSSIFKSCGDLDSLRFLYRRSFIESQKELKSTSYNTQLTNYYKVDIYKLLSFQQLIYRDISNGNFNLENIYLYIDYVNNLLISTSLEQFYYEEIYRFNNVYLNKSLETKQYSSPQLIKDIDKLRQKLLWLNSDNLLINYRGLDYHIINKNLKTDFVTTSLDSQQNEYDGLEYQILEMSKNLSFFVVVWNRILDNKDVELQWYFLLSFDEVQKPLYVELVLFWDKPSLIVKSISIKHYLDLTQIITALIKWNSWSLLETYQYIISNISLYRDNIEDFGFCEYLKSQIEKWDQTVVRACTDDVIYVIQWTGSSKFILNNYQLVSLLSTDKDKVEFFNTTYSGVKTDDVSLASIVGEVLDYSKSLNDNNIYEWSEKVLASIERLQEYLKIWANDVVESWSQIYFDVTIQWVSLLFNYDYDNNVIDTIIFKDIKVGDRYLTINDFDLVLESTNRNNINLFTVDPLWYMRKYFPTIYLLYLQDRI